jgi:tetratricopeptide (TPR) repeat protein
MKYGDIFKSHVFLLFIILSILFAYDAAFASASKEWVKKGNVHAKAGRHREAIKAYTKAIEKNPKDKVAYGNRGNSYFELGDYKNAIKDYTTVIKLAPKNSFVYYNRALAYYRSGNQKQGLSDMKTSAKMGFKRAQAHLRSKGIKWQ